MVACKTNGCEARHLIDYIGENLSAYRFREDWETPRLIDCPSCGRVNEYSQRDWRLEVRPYPPENLTQ